MFVCAMPFTLIPWFNELIILLILSATFGLTEAIVTSSAPAMVSDFCREGDLGSAMGKFGATFDVGHASGALLAGFLISAFGSSVDYRIPFAIVASLIIVAAIAFSLGIKSETKQKNGFNS